jgi:hypothetical protein
MRTQHEMLAAGEYAAALAMSDQELSVNDQIFRHYGVSRWHGEEELSGKRILVTHQWGLGDCILALRYVPLLGAESVSVSVPDPLIRTAACTGADVYGASVPVDWFDYHVPIMRLIGFFREVPAPPYIHADSLLRPWAVRLANGRRRVGIAWSGNPKHLRNATRCIDLEALIDLLPGDCQPYSLQNSDHEKARGLGVIAPDYTDFAEVSAVAALMDEIVTIDTAAANLVGAMNLKATVLLDSSCDWRWRTSDQWYPSLTKRVCL